MKLLFSIKGFNKNIGCYFMTCLLVLFIIFIFIHIFTGQKRIMEIINSAIKAKGEEIDKDNLKKLIKEKEVKTEKNKVEENIKENKLNKDKNKNKEVKKEETSEQKIEKKPEKEK